MAERKLKPLSAQQLRERYESMDRVLQETDQSDRMKGVDKDWEEFRVWALEHNPRFLRAAEALSRQYLMQGVLLGQGEALGVKVPKDRQVFKELLGEIAFRSSYLYRQTCSPEAMLKDSTYMIGVGRVEVWH